MTRTALTDARIRALRPRKTAHDIRDGKLGGFGVRVLTSATYVEVKREKTASVAVGHPEKEIGRATWERGVTSFAFLDDAAGFGHVNRYRIRAAADRRSHAGSTPGAEGNRRSPPVPR